MQAFIVKTFAAVYIINVIILLTLICLAQGSANFLRSRAG